MDEIDPPPAEPASLTPTEARVLGCLIEKAALTPDVYPMTVNALVVAANQKTSRDPLMELEPGAVGHTLRQLEDKGLVRVIHSSRALRYEHQVDAAWVVTVRQRAVLCMLLLRGPQTLNELFTRTERLAQFPDLEEVRATVERLCQRSPPMATCLGRASGQREDRYMHLLCGLVSLEQFASAAEESVRPGRSDLLERVERLERELEELKARLDALGA